MADVDTLAKEVDENLSALDTTFGAEDTLLDEKLLEAAKTLQDGQVYESVVEGEKCLLCSQNESGFGQRSNRR